MSHIAIYTSFLKKFLKVKRSLNVIFDCSNGTAGLVLRKLKTKNLKLKIIDGKPDGNFPAHGPNPMYDEALNDLRKAIRKYKADFGVIFDGDGDRVFFVDDKGRRLAPDVSALLISKNFSGPIILSSTMGFLAHREIKKDGKRIMDWKVGHYFMKRKMAEKNICFGAEHSGHFYFGANGFGKLTAGKFYFDSGILSAIYFMNSVSKINSKLSEWVDNLPKIYRSGELNFKIRDKEAAMRKIEKIYKNHAQKISHLDGLRMEFKNTWFSLRPSGTEDLIRLNLEAGDKKVFDQELKKIKRLIKN